MLRFIVLFFGALCVQAQSPAGTAPASPLSVSYYTPFVDAINPATWIRNTAESYLKERLRHDFVRQQALYNVIACLAKEGGGAGGGNCRSLLEAADPFFRTPEPPHFHEPRGTEANPVDQRGLGE